MYLTRSGLSRPGIFLLVTILLVTILKARPHGSFSTSPIKSFQYWSRLFYMPYLRADFAFSHASCSRESPFKRVNLLPRCKAFPTQDRQLVVPPVHWVPGTPVTPSRHRVVTCCDHFPPRHTYPRHLYPNEPRVGFQEIRDVQIRAADKDPSPPWCILVPSRVFGPFVLLTNEQHIGPPLPGSLNKKVLGFLSSPEVELQELRFLPLNLLISALNIGQEPLPEAWATSFSPLSAQVRHRGRALHSLATCDAPHTSSKHPSCLEASYVCWAECSTFRSRCP